MSDGNSDADNFEDGIDLMFDIDEEGFMPSNSPQPGTSSGLTRTLSLSLTLTLRLLDQARASPWTGPIPA